MDQPTLITVLAWMLMTVGGLLLSALIWFARRSVAQADRVQRIMTRMLLRLSILESKAGIRTTSDDLADMEP